MKVLLATVVSMAAIAAAAAEPNSGFSNRAIIPPKGGEDVHAGSHPDTDSSPNSDGDSRSSSHDDDPNSGSGGDADDEGPFGGPGESKVDGFTAPPDKVGGFTNPGPKKTWDGIVESVAEQATMFLSGDSSTSTQSAPPTTATDDSIGSQPLVTDSETTKVQYTTTHGTSSHTSSPTDSAAAPKAAMVGALGAALGVAAILANW